MGSKPGIWNVVRVALPCFIGSPAFAQETDTAVFRVGEIVVQATRPITTTGGASALEVRLDSLRLRAAPTLEELLRTLPLVQVRTNSRGEAQFSLRGSGSDARQVAVLIDGIPLNLSWDDRADLSVLPTTAAQSIALSRGLPSLLYGPNVLGGVVEIGVARGATALLNPRSLRFEAGTDQHGGYGVSAALTLPLTLGRSELLVRAGGGRRARDGFALPDDVVQPVAGPDPALRLNTDLAQTDAFGALRLQSPTGAWAAFTAAAATSERGIPAELHTDNPRFWRYPEQRRALAVISGGSGERTSPVGGIADVELSVGLDAGHTEIDQYATADYETIVSSDDSDDRNITVRMRADQTITRRGALRAAFTYADINHDEVLTPGSAGSYRQRLWSFGSEFTLRTDSGTLRGTRISAGAAYDGAETPESADKPPLAALRDWAARAGFTTVASPRVLIHGGISRRVRFPALRELYSGALGRFEPNSALEPEKLVAAEAGATMRLGRGELQVVAFHHRLSDAIVRVATADGRFKRVNRDEQRTTGLELLALASTARITLGAELTLQSTTLADDTGTEFEAEYQPDVLAGGNLTVALPVGLRLDLRGKHAGRQSCVHPDTNAHTEIEPAARYDAELGRSWKLASGWASQVEIGAAVDNIADRAIYDQCGLPQPGRVLRVQLRLR